MIYLDNAATTQPDLATIRVMNEAMKNTWGNPSSLHDVGKDAKRAVDHARKQIADGIGAAPDEIIFTSGGSESDNLALRGIVSYLKTNGKTTIITSAIEHHAVLHTCQDLEKDGFTVIYMPVDIDGRVDIEELNAVMEENRQTLGLVSIMAVNNEVGAIQLVEDIGVLCKEYDTIFMTDAVQALGHIHIDVKSMNIDLLSASGHKINAVKGVGFLYISERIKKYMNPEITGGGQEDHLRAGTENVFGIVAMGDAVESLILNMDAFNYYYCNMRDEFIRILDENKIDYKINSDYSVPNIISLTLPHCESEAMLLLLNEKEICVSAGSACTAGMLEPSHVLKALYLSDEEASCTIRISMGIYNTDEEIRIAAQCICDAAKQLRAMIL